MPQVQLSGWSRAVMPAQQTAVLCMALLISGGFGTAFAQTVDIMLPDDADAGLRTILENASLTRTLADSGQPAEPGAAAVSAPTPTDFIAAARADYRRILTGLYAEGYYGGTISILADGREVANIAPLDAPARIGAITISVTPGPLFAFGRADIAPLAPGTALPDGFATGQTARAEEIRGAVRTAATGWREIGYPRVEAGAQDIVANHPQSRLDVAVQMLPGPQLRFGTVTVSGNDGVRTERVLEIAGLPEGAIYDPAEIAAAQTRLRRAGAFSAVALIESETNGPDDTLPMEIQVVEQAPRRIGFGAEYSTLDGITLTTFWLHRNLLGGAERLRIEGEISGLQAVADGHIDAGEDGVDYRIAAAFSRPATFRSDVDLTANAALQRLDEPQYLLDQLSADIGLMQFRTDQLTYGAGIGFITAREQTDIRTREYTLITAPLSGTYDRRNTPLDATAGFYLDLDITPFVDVVGEAGSGARIYGDARFYRSFGENDRVTLAARGQIGAVVGADLHDAPADFLFYSGGGGTVRGQAFQSLGITSFEDFGSGPTEITTGGKSFVGAQLEARVNVTDTIGLVGFYDIGIVGAESVIQAGDDFQAGAGLGLRYDTGIGPIRLDVATPVTGDSAYGRVEIYLGIGQSF